MCGGGVGRRMGHGADESGSNDNSVVGWLSGWVVGWLHLLSGLLSLSIP
jgi:hypothetical protein